MSNPESDPLMKERMLNMLEELIFAHDLTTITGEEVVVELVENGESCLSSNADAELSEELAIEKAKKL